jgi:hypothetical protein
MNDVRITSASRKTILFGSGTTRAQRGRCPKSRVLPKKSSGLSKNEEGTLTSWAAPFSAELSLAQTKRNELLSLVQLYKALGGGWQQ